MDPKALSDLEPDIEKKDEEEFVVFKVIGFESSKLPFVPSDYYESHMKFLASGSEFPKAFISHNDKLITYHEVIKADLKPGQEIIRYFTPSTGVKRRAGKSPIVTVNGSEVDKDGNEVAVFTEEDYDGFDEDFESMRYNGLDLMGVRRKIVEFDDIVAVVKLVLRALSAFVNVGNNVAALGKKVMDGEHTKKIQKDLKRLKIVKTASKPDDLTLPRIALAFMPAYLALRWNKRALIQTQTGSTFPSWGQDLVFAGVPEFNGNEQYMIYYREFSKLIEPKDKYDKVEGKDAAEKEANIKKEREEDLTRWLNVAKTGYQSDSVIHDQMKSVLGRIKANESFNTADVFNITAKLIETFGKE